MLDIPGYDVAALVEKSGKSASHIYARLSLLQLIPAVAEAFTQERITASHANLIARLPQDVQANSYEQCWRKDWQDKEPHLLPAKHLAAWIQANLYRGRSFKSFSQQGITLPARQQEPSLVRRWTAYMAAGGGCCVHPFRIGHVAVGRRHAPCSGESG